ncbi:MAG: 1-deoxy-D-xylulose-5-phosphate synthase [Candidatus Omnitrophica bacterium]|nr:1-deoxy-D-xylulose-5-phosphate synthase [Candidatus Omnitrophota bacterium]MBD3268689.1 1-deoxy-D-xylulose-5-phosphate synthase [Candidatus Omnitrophota bacterium]
MLESINSPQDLRRIKQEKLNDLAAEIREFIIKVVSDKGGHLASSLGAVELCIALHYCLNTPEDTLVFDVGHQTYAHKILTGRKDKFYTLRQYEGLSGFPNFYESVYDTYISGHASTAISWAQGIAEAKRLKKETSKTVAVVGDGSLSGGMCFEALNSCGHAKTDLLVVLNHNEMSISPSVGALSNYLTRIISAPIYNRARKELENFLQSFSLTKKLAAKARKLEENIKGLLIPGVFFEELGFRYFGPIDGHDLDVLVPALGNISELSGPRILHVITKKGKGYVFSEKNPEVYHGISSFDKDTGECMNRKGRNFTRVFAEKLVDLGRKDENIAAITAAMPTGTGLCLFKENFPERFYDVGIAESHAVGFASGLAKKGVKPVVAIYSTFLQRAFDQIIHDVALQDLGVIFAIDRAGLVGEDGPTHHGVFDIGYLRMIPNMVCMAPKDARELEDMLEMAAELKHPVSIRYPRGESFYLESKNKLEFGKAEILRDGEDFCIIALGTVSKAALECADNFQREGLNPCLVNARFIKPLDEEMLREIAERFSLVITLEEGNLAGGFGDGVLEFYEKENMLQKVEIFRIGLPDEFIPAGEKNSLYRIYALEGNSLFLRIKQILQQSHVSKTR